MSGFVLRSVYVDHDVDRTMIAHGKRLGAPSGVVFRMALDAGLSLLSAGERLPAAHDAVPVLRLVNMRYEVAETLRVLEYDRRIKWGPLVQRITRLGLRFLETIPWMPYLPELGKPRAQRLIAQSWTELEDLLGSLDAVEMHLGIAHRLAKHIPARSRASRDLQDLLDMVERITSKLNTLRSTFTQSSANLDATPACATREANPLQQRVDPAPGEASRDRITNSR